jgi:hypothetical protein
VVVMQMPTDDVVDVALVRDGLVPAAGAVLVVATVRPTRVARSAHARVAGRDAELVLVHVVAVHVVHVTVVQVVLVPVVLHALVPATGAVRVRVILVGLAGVHARPLGSEQRVVKPHGREGGRTFT